MSKNSFFRRYTEYEALKIKFENDREYDARISTDFYYYEGKENKLKEHYLHCNKCESMHVMDELTFMNGKVECKCGAKYAPEDIAPELRIWTHGKDEFRLHNLNNGTYRKVSVPTLVAREYFYCPKCRQTHKLDKMPVENGQRLCSCGELYSFDEIKLTHIDNHITTFGTVFYDNNKVTMTFSKYFTSINAKGNFYWQEGRQRLTMNLDTGFSYMTNTGYCYRLFNEYYRRVSDKKAPKMYNCTYGNSNDTLATVASAIKESYYDKYSQYENLINFIERKQYALKQIIFNKLLKQMDEYMTSYYNSIFNYRIKSFEECIGGPRHVLQQVGGKKSKSKMKSLINMYDCGLLVLHNRFINLDYNDLKFALSDIINIIQYQEAKRNYKKLSRETNNINLEYVTKSISCSKNLRKKISAYLESGAGISYNRMNDRLYTFVNICKHFKNKENINKIYNTLINFDNIRVRYEANDHTMKLWLQHRNETYISNCNAQELKEKIQLMDDAEKTISRIRDVYGDDWDLNSIKFYNEEQFHDDLVRVTTSEDFIYLQNKAKNERQMRPFEMEDDIYELEEKENDIYVATNRAILSNIGSAMGICVGSYGGSVESGRSRIVYIKENGLYKVCIELNRYKNKTTGKYEYTIIQSKLAYNELCGTSEVYYNKVLEWAQRNNVEIDTNDMLIKYNKQQQAIEF